MVKRPQRSSWSLSVFHFNRFRSAVVLIVLFSFLPNVTLGRASLPDLSALATTESDADFIVGPQAPMSGSWFDTVEVAKAQEHGAAFPATPPPADQMDPYILAYYYDLGLTEYIAYKRTGDPIFLSYARKVTDSWWLAAYIQGGNVRNFDTAGPAPRYAGIGGLALRAMDGRPEMWDWINAYTRYHFDNWLKRRINDPELYIGIREGAFMLHAAVWLAKVLPDTFPLQAGGTATNGATLRAQYLADVEAVAVNYFGRLQYPDGSFRWDDDYYTDADGGQLRGITQPFMVGLLLNALIDAHRLSTNSTVKANIQNQITKACLHLYQDGPYRKDEPVIGLTGKRWRSFWYFYHGGTTVNPTKYENGGGSYTAADQNWIVKSERQGISTIFSAYGYAYLITGDPVFKTMGDELYESAFGNETDGIHNEADGTPKNYNQNYRMGGRYLIWREGGSFPTPTPTPTPTVTPSPTPTATPSPTPTATPSPTPTATPTPAPTPPPNPLASASFVVLDTTTKGNWKNTYGSQGYNTINDALSYPSYAQINVTGYTSPTWDDSTTDVRALQKSLGTDRVAARWSANSSFTIDLNLTDGQAHRVALYNLDWDGNNRAQRIDVLDWATDALLDTRSIASFNGGQYLVWDLRGHVKITVNRTGAKTAVLSGLYFGAAPNVTPTPTPSPSPSPTPTPSPGSNIPPAVVVTAPSINSVFGTGSNVTIQSLASDTDGSVAKVDFYKNGILLGSTTASPYNYVWTSVPSGNYSLTAVATDNRGATTTSSSVAIAVKNSPASVERARGRGNTLISELSTSPSYGGSDTTYATANLAGDLLLLANDVQTAYSDFVAEQTSFGSLAGWINTQVAAALYLSKSDAALAAKVGSSTSVRNQLLRVVAHLSVAEDLMLYRSVSSATQVLAAAANARLDLVIGPAPASYTLNGAAQLAPQSLGSAFGDAVNSPFSSETQFAPIGAGGTVPYELGGVNVTVNGRAVPITFVSPSRISFYVAPEIPTGTAEVIVTSQNGFVARGLTTIVANATWLFTTNENDGGSAVALNAARQTSGSFGAITQENFGSDKRTRVSLFVTGISGSAVNSNPSNDIYVDGILRQNFAESVAVQARLSTGVMVTLPVEFAGKQGLLPGLDQMTFVIPSQLAGAGIVQLTFVLGGKRSNGGTIVVL